jgi:hypothetical protein
MKSLFTWLVAGTAIDKLWGAAYNQTINYDATRHQIILILIVYGVLEHENHWIFLFRS